MSDFTKEELIALKNGIDYLPQSVNLDKKYQEMCDRIIVKIESMIDNYPMPNAQWAAKSHLNEASNLIYHAKCLLGLKDE